MKTTVLLLTCASLTALNGAEQQAPILPTTPKNPKSLIEITFEKIYGNHSEQYETIKEFIKNDNVEAVWNYFNRCKMYAEKKGISLHTLFSYEAQVPKTITELKNLPAIRTFFLYAPSLRMIDLIIEKTGFDVKSVDHNGHTLLFYSNIHPVAARYAIENGCRIDHAIEHGFTALHCCGDHKPEIIHLLLEKGAHPNQPSEFGFTPLRYCSNVAIAKMLIAQGADPSRPNEFGFTPLHYCSDIDVAKFLVEQGANLFAKNTITKELPHEYNRTPNVRRYLKEEYEKQKALLPIKNIRNKKPRQKRSAEESAKES